MVEESEGEPPVIDLKRAMKLFEDNGAVQEELDEFNDIKPEQFPELVSTNIINTKAFVIKTEGLDIKVKPEYTSRVECRMIDGRPCIVMAVSDYLEVNGITARPVPVNVEGPES